LGIKVDLYVPNKRKEENKIKAKKTYNAELVKGI
jgi:hypothetical protein